MISDYLFHWKIFELKRLKSKMKMRNIPISSMHFSFAFWRIKINRLRSELELIMRLKLESTTLVGKGLSLGLI